MRTIIEPFRIKMTEPIHIISKDERIPLAFPRQVYTQNHFDYIIEVIKKVWKIRHSYTGLKITKQPKMLRHFSCHFENIT
ncbi:hypothetical protein [uncultured Shewanella sp.]|uniref:hypothetical protein n=1 Tax=uncultured Shewanella sp. TaxID=173975 RepID=UPI00262EBEB1|nr:hypothetical protein [uncultured Shewanella sp.]